MNNYDVLAYVASIFSQFLYNPPTKEEWENIKKEKLLLEWFIHSDDSSILKADKLWKKSHLKENHLDLSVDYTDLFICDEVSLKAPAYASYYLDITGELYSKESDKVKQIYGSCSFFTNALLGQPADFIAIELEFISKLLFNVKKDVAFEKVLKAFLEENFLPWVQVWSEDMQNNAKSYFYKGLGFHMESFCNMLRDEFSIEIQENKVLRKAS